jgi:hypothetical protein
MGQQFDRAVLSAYFRAASANAEAARELVAQGRLGHEVCATCRGRTDGAGAQANAVIKAMIMARHLGWRYLHSPFSAMGHNVGTEQDWAARWERFLNLGDGEAPVPETAELVSLGDLVSDPEAYRGRPVVVAELIFLLPEHSVTSVLDELRPELRAKYWRSDKSGIPLHRGPPGGMTVAVHLRRGDVADDPRRYVATEALLRSIADLRRALAPFGRPVHINLYSEGEPADFRAYADAGCELHIDVDPFETFHNMVIADILMQGRSSFSRVAGLLSQGIVIESNGHGKRPKNRKSPENRKPLANWQSRRRNGELSVKRLRLALLAETGWPQWGLVQMRRGLEWLSSRRRPVR